MLKLISFFLSLQFLMASQSFESEFKIKIDSALEKKNLNTRFTEFCKVNDWVLKETEATKDENLVTLFARYYSLKPICDQKSYKSFSENRGEVKRAIERDWGVGSGVKKLPEIAQEALNFVDILSQ